MITKADIQLWIDAQLELRDKRHLALMLSPAISRQTVPEAGANCSEMERLQQMRHLLTQITEEG